MASAKKLYRSNNSVLAGVCAGIAEYLKVDSAVVRILAVLLLVVSGGVAGILYLVLWLILPRQAAANPETIPASASGEAYPQQPPYFRQEQSAPVAEGPSLWAKLGVMVGLIFLAVGISGLVDSVVDGVHWWQLWPAVIILAGFVSAFTSSPGVSLTWRISRSLATIAVGGVLLCCSIGSLAWSSIPFALSQLWPVVFILLGFAIVGAALHNGLLAPAFALCVVLVCAAIMTVYAIPGYLDTVSLEMPLMNIQMLDVNPWR